MEFSITTFLSDACQRYICSRLRAGYGERVNKAPVTIFLASVCAFPLVQKTTFTVMYATGYDMPMKLRVKAKQLVLNCDGFMVIEIVNKYGTLFYRN